MKLEEVMQYIADKKFDLLEFRVPYGDIRSDWLTVDRHILSHTIETLLHTQFRLKKKEPFRVSFIASIVGHHFERDIKKSEILLLPHDPCDVNLHILIGKNWDSLDNLKVTIEEIVEENFK